MSKNGQSIRVLGADGSVFIRKRLSMMRMKCSDLQVVGAAMNGHDSIEQAKGTQPDVMLLDIEMPSVNGFRSIQSYDGSSPTPQHHGMCPHG